MFKPKKEPSIIRQRVMEKIEEHVSRAEETYARLENSLIEQDALERQNLYSEQERRHANLLEETVNGIVGKIL